MYKRQTQQYQYHTRCTYLPGVASIDYQVYSSTAIGIYTSKTCAAVSKAQHNPVIEWTTPLCSRAVSCSWVTFRFHVTATLLKCLVVAALCYHTYSHTRESCISWLEPIESAPAMISGRWSRNRHCPKPSTQLALLHGTLTPRESRSHRVSRYSCDISMFLVYASAKSFQISCGEKMEKRQQMARSASVTQKMSPRLVYIWSTFFISLSFLLVVLASAAARSDETPRTRRGCTSARGDTGGAK